MLFRESRDVGCETQRNRQNVELKQVIHRQPLGFKGFVQFNYSKHKKKHKGEFQTWNWNGLLLDDFPIKI